MKKLKRILAVIICMVMLLATTPTVGISTEENGKSVQYVYDVKSADATGTDVLYVNEKEYKIVDSTNLISNGDFSNGMTDWTDAATGAELDWIVTDDAIYAGGSGCAATNKTAAGGSKATTMRRFVEVEAGKQYYLSYNAYNTDSETTANGMMSAAVLTSGGPVYGSFDGLSYYNYNIYGGMNSWSDESNTQVGGNISRWDDRYSVGMNKKEFIFNVPVGATHLMLSFGAWTTPGQIYWSNFKFVEVEGVNNETDNDDVSTGDEGISSVIMYRGGTTYNLLTTTQSFEKNPMRR
ncbi:MAG: hypothetical protein LUG52_00525 [Clostridia bacterium]|nr:hypothetical protein [Clostridia bacterium]